MESDESQTVSKILKEWWEECTEEQKLETFKEGQKECKYLLPSLLKNWLILQTSPRFSEILASTSISWEDPYFSLFIPGVYQNVSFF